MANPVTKIRNTAADYRKLDGRDKRRFWTDGILNNALRPFRSRSALRAASS